MKSKLLCGAVAMAATFACINADAATATAPANTQNDPSLFCNWTGFYLGISGGAWQRTRDTLSVENTAGFNTFSPTAILGINASGTSSLDENRAFGGAQLGYNQQTGDFVWGVEANANNLNVKAEHGGTFNYLTNGNPYLLTTQAKTNWLFTLDPRIGWAVNHALFYIKGGVSVAQLYFKQAFTNLNTPVVSESASFSQTKTGWNAGAGLEFALNDHWTIRAEYLFNQFGSETARGNLSVTPTQNTVFTNSLDHRNVQMLSAGINYLIS